MADDWEVYQNMNQLEFNKALLQCSFCSCLLSPPIYLDSNGMNICKTCKTENNIEAIRNVPLEASWKPCKTMFPCKYFQNGCQEVLMKDTLLKHQRFCHHGPIKCPKCKKEGFKNITEVIEHCLDDHEMQKQNTNQQPIQLKLKEFDENENEVTNLFQVCINKNDFIIKVAQVQHDELQVIVCCPTGEKVNCELFLRIQEGNQETRCPAKINEAWNMLNSTDDAHVTKIYLTEKRNKSIDAEKRLVVELMFNNNPNKFQLKQLKEPDNFRKDIECPICFNFLLEEVFKCPNGHNICGSCKTLITTCPVCRETMNDTHDVRLENMLPQISMNCWNAEFGCLVVSDLKALKKHEMTCAYNQFACHIAQCKYESTQFNLIKHYTDKHAVSANGSRLEATLDTNLSACIVYVNTIFLLETWNRDNQFVWSLKLLNSVGLSSQFVYEIELLDVNNGKLFNLVNTCGNNVSIDMDVVQKVLFEDKLIFKCFIRKLVL